MDKLRACASCDKTMSLQKHQELVHPHADIRIPLCDHCLEFPYRIDVSRSFAAVYSAGLESTIERSILEAIMRNKTERYQNPTPVIIGLILLELDHTGGVVLAGRRADSMKEYPGELALLSGYMETKHRSWRGALKAEGHEELCVDIDVENEELVVPSAFSSAAGGRLLLNWATVLPGATALSPFTPNEETSERLEIPFYWDERPQFGIPQHNGILEDFCQMQALYEQTRRVLTAN